MMDIARGRTTPGREDDPTVVKVVQHDGAAGATGPVYVGSSAWPVNSVPVVDGGSVYYPPYFGGAALYPNPLASAQSFTGSTATPGVDGMPPGYWIEMEPGYHPPNPDLHVVHPHLNLRYVVEAGTTVFCFPTMTAKAGKWLPPKPIPHANEIPFPLSTEALLLATMVCLVVRACWQRVRSHADRRSEDGGHLSFSRSAILAQSA